MAEQLKSIDELLGPEPKAAAAGGLPSIDELLGPEQPTAQNAVAPTPPPSGLFGRAASAYGRYAAQMGTGMAKGLAGTLGLVGDLQDLGNKYLPSGHNWPMADDWHPSWLPTSADTSKAFDDGLNKLGVDAAGLEPKTAFERVAQGVAKGAGGALLPNPLGLAGGMAAGANAGLFGGLAHEVAPESTVAPVVAGLVGGGLGQSAFSGLARRSLSDIAKGLGSSTTLTDAGQHLQEGARDWLQNTHPKLQAEAWAPVDAALPSTTPTPIGGFTAALSSLKKPAGSLQGVADVLQPSMADKLIAGLDKSTASLGVTPSWQDAKTLRSILGDAMSNPQITKDLPQQALSKLYASLTGDMRTAAHGAGAGEAFDAANAASKELFGVAEGPMRKLVKGPTADPSDLAPEVVASRLLSGANKGGTDIAALRAHLPDQVDELASAALNQPKVLFHKMAPDAQSALISSPSAQRAALAASKAASGSSVADNTNLTAHILGGSVLGEALGTFAGHGLGLAGSDLIAPEAGKMIALGLPVAYHGAKRLVQNPISLTGPAIGAAEGEDQFPPLTVRKRAGQ